MITSDFFRNGGITKNKKRPPGRLYILPGGRRFTAYSSVS
ncbi:hypothetical protein CLOSTHATH_00834 [Hungatella hathewayi DSM 13479]|uniref:Uncharacterized protein n=1 Tax=Hungatella hathewayi DSM 13479 TaxID=566550 RepID=D3AB63_9FIRM|nr:hypothetical protein CLOSTHATH_00834 [Hungatella hathewayi DSM 13479]